MKFKTFLNRSLVGGALVVLVASAAHAQMAPFGNDQDISYAKTLWGVLESAKLIGAGSITSRPYEGGEPHGFVLETVATKVTVDGHTGIAIVKKNYGPEGVSVEDVVTNPAEHLAAVTVMFKREAGYDPEDQDWFWVKYMPDGSLDKNPAGMQLAGKVAKGANAGCIACHKGAGGDDMVFTPINLD